MSEPILCEAESESAQENLGARLARACPDSCVVYLSGDLGAGKTTLVRGFLRRLGHAGPVKSPTYTLLEIYELPTRTCCHLDLYRLSHPEEIEYLGIRDLLSTEVVFLIEWPERGRGWLPAPDLEVRIEHRGSGRRLRFSSRSAKGKVLLQQYQEAGVLDSSQ